MVANNTTSPLKYHKLPPAKELKRLSNTIHANNATTKPLKGELATVHIEYRWAAALLGQAYAQQIAKIQHDDSMTSNDRTRNRYGKGPVRKEASMGLLSLVSPRATEKDRLVFRKQLARASRWYTVAQALGWGSLALMPHDDVPNSWIESSLLTGELAIWIALVKKENLDVYAAGKALEEWLGPECIAGGPIAAKSTLSIEADVLATIYEVEDSEDGMRGLDDDLDVLPTQKSLTSTVPLC
ncbi:hypothetical protein J1614_012199 [Plenodomus biglobosus]|nr:hypothetical protein J1614_012199 [Plenodomus biglobosus]